MIQITGGYFFLLAVGFWGPYVCVFVVFNNPKQERKGVVTEEEWAKVTCRRQKSISVRKSVLPRS